MRYNSKIVCFLANGNSVLVKDETDLKLLKQIFNSVGLDAKQHLVNLGENVDDYEIKEA